MLTKSTLIAAVAVATVSIATPAFAQAFAKGWGTGNSMTTYYDHNGALNLGAAPQMSNTQVAAERNGQNVFAQARQPSRQELSAIRQGDYYAPSKTVVQQATPQQRAAFREGDFYAPAID